MRSGGAGRGGTGGCISLHDQKASHSLPDHEIGQILIVCRDEVARIFTSHRAFAIEKWVNLGGGKGLASGRREVMMVPERTPPFSRSSLAIVGDEKAGFAPGGLLDAYQSVVPELGRSRGVVEQ
jgi:hypothetical protein